MIDHKHWIQTYTGKAFDYLDTRPEQIDIRDIAHALANINRYTGHTFRPYSVAQHSVLVARHAGLWNDFKHADLARARYGLLHDASEAYLQDIASPLKGLLKDYKELEERVTVAILMRFGVDLDEATEKAVMHSDIVMLMTEKRDLLGPSPQPWRIDVEPSVVGIDPLSWRSAEALFLTEFNNLFPEHRI